MIGRHKELWNVGRSVREYLYEVDDAGLFERARHGDETALSTLFERYQRAIYRYATYMGGPELGDDIVQETFLTILRQSGQYDRSRGTPVLQYPFGIARHLTQKRIGRHDPETSDLETTSHQIPLSPATSVLDDLTRAETIAVVRTAVRSLPPFYRETIVLCDLEEMNYADAAGVLQVPIGTVRSRLHRARMLLTAKLAGLRQASGSRSEA